MTKKKGPGKRKTYVVARVLTARFGPTGTGEPKPKRKRPDAPKAKRKANPRFRLGGRRRGRNASPKP